MENGYYYNNNSYGNNPYGYQGGVAPVPEKRCPHCNALLMEGQQICPVCGCQLSKICAGCGAEVAEGQAFCQVCGTSTASAVVGMAPNPAIVQYNNTVAEKKSSKLPIIIGSVGGGVLLLIVLLVFLLGGDADFFKEEFSEYADEEWCEIASDGSYMIIDTNPHDLEEENEWDADDAIMDINVRLGFSKYLYEDEMCETSYNDGRQYAESKDYEASWIYHPNRGLEVKYTKK